MKNSSHIEDVMTALEEAIEGKKADIENAHSRSGMPMLSSLFSEALNRASGPLAQMNTMMDEGVGVAKDFLENTQQRLKQDPWGALRKVALYSFAAGLFLSWRRRKSAGTD